MQKPINTLSGELNHLKKIKWILLFGFLLTSKSWSYGLGKNDDKHTSGSVDSSYVYVFKDNLFGYGFFRIPAIVRTGDGILLAFAEGRYDRKRGDSGDIDLVLRRSFDDGKTWSDLIVVWNDNENTCGNPVPIVDMERGRIHLLMTWNGGRDKGVAIANGNGYNTRRPYYTYSDDNGQTWSIPMELTNIKKSGWGWYGTGPVHGIQIQKGKYKGRLVSPCYYSTVIDGEQFRFSHVIYSDDYGSTWQSGSSTPKSGVGECAVAELSDGKLMLNMRPKDGYYRYSSISSDGGETWREMVENFELIDPRCQGSIIGAETYLLFSNNSSKGRNCITVKMSKDDGNSWTKQYQIYKGASGYSDVVLISDEKLAILYERGIKRYSEGIAFEVINLKQLK